MWIFSGPFQKFRLITNEHEYMNIEIPYCVRYFAKFYKNVLIFSINDDKVFVSSVVLVVKVGCQSQTVDNEM